MKDTQIKRGDRSDTGDNKTRRREGVSEAGSGVSGGGAVVTADASALARSPAMGEGTAETADETGGEFDENTGELGELSIHDAADPSLGLTNVGDVPADDWAADTGATQSGEAGSHGASRELADEDVSADGHKIDFERGRRR